MRIPESWMDRHGNVSIFYERLEPDYFAEEKVDRCDLKILYEAPRNGFSYGCSPPDVLKVLRAAGSTVPSLPEIVAFRQPTRNQSRLQSVWGRFVYNAEIGRHEGPAIILEAQEIGSKLNRSRRMTIDGQSEFDRLKADGHSFSESRRGFQSTLSAEGVRNTILYRTLLHELGHCVQYHNDVLNTATALHRDRDVAWDLHFSRPSSEREAFAHRFAGELAALLRSAGIIPFEPIVFEA